MATPPATATSSPLPAVAAGRIVVAQPVDQLGRGLVLRRGGRDDPPQRGGRVGRVVGDRVADERDAGVGGDGVGDRLQRRRVGARRHLGGQAERAVEARPEAVGEQVVRLAGGGVVGVVAFVGEAEAQPEDRQRQRDQRGGADQHRRPRPMLDDPAPPVRQRLAQRLALPLQHRLAQRGDGEARQQHDDRDRQA